MSQKMKERGKEWKECQRHENKGSMMERMIESKRERERLSQWKEICERKWVTFLLSSTVYFQ